MKKCLKRSWSRLRTLSGTATNIRKRKVMWHRYRHSNVRRMRREINGLANCNSYDAGSLTNMPKTSKWFEEECAKKYLKKSLWTVFLCYDTDAYKYEVSPYYEGDWKDLQDKIGKVKEIVDLAAAADIEDVLLMDFEGICKYIGVEKPDRSLLKGRKGSAKMKALFRSYGKTYHKGERTQSLIENLDLQKIIDSNILPLSQIEAAFQGKNDF